MEITHIVTVGCSFTYCQNLPIDQGWPALLARQLKCPLVNLGLPGQGNDAIHRRLHEYLYNNKVAYPNSKPLVIIFWSQPMRRERWVKKHVYNNNYNYYAPVNLPIQRNGSLMKEKDMTAYEHEFFINYAEEEGHRNTIIHKTSTVNLLNSLNIPFIMTDAMAQDYNTTDYQNVKDKFPGLVEAHQVSNYIEPLHHVISKSEKNCLPCGHYGPELCEVIKNFLIDNINEIYPSTVFINGEHLTLSEYGKNDAYIEKFPEWLNFQL